MTGVEKTRTALQRSTQALTGLTAAILLATSLATAQVGAADRNRSLGFQGNAGSAMEEDLRSTATVCEAKPEVIRALAARALTPEERNHVATLWEQFAHQKETRAKKFEARARALWSTPLPLTQKSGIGSRRPRAKALRKKARELRAIAGTARAFAGEQRRFALRAKAETN